MNKFKSKLRYEKWQISLELKISWSQVFRFIKLNVAKNKHKLHIQCMYNDI